MDPPNRTSGIAASFLLCAGTLAVIEILFRVVFPMPEVVNFNRMDYSNVWFTDAVTPSVKLSHDSFVYDSEPDGVAFVHTLNLYGFRDREWTMAKTKERIIFVGDSFVEGFMAEAAETIPRGFEAAAAGRGRDLEVINLGVGATDLPDYSRRLRDAVPLFMPDHVILVLYENDFRTPKFDSTAFDDPLVPQYHSKYLPRIYEVLLRVWRGHTVALAWSRPPFRFWSPVPSPLNEWTHREAEFAAYVDPKIGAMMKAGRFMPGQADEVNTQARFSRLTADVRPHLAQIYEYLKRHGASLFVCYIPYRHQVSDYYLRIASTYSRDEGIKSMRGKAFQIHRRHLAQVCLGLGIPFLDLTPLLQEKEDRGEHMYWDYDVHMRGEANLFLADRIFDTWRDANL